MSRIIKNIYVIMYISSYKHGNPYEPEFIIFEDKFFYEYETALNYAKFRDLKYDEYEIERLELGAIGKNE